MRRARPAWPPQVRGSNQAVRRHVQLEHVLCCVRALTPSPRLAGELIALQCDSVVCPNPEVRDCYMRDGVCADDEWCRLEDHLKFGPFGMVGGQTPNNIGYQARRPVQRQRRQRRQRRCGG